jgi:hypothetical protein
VPGPYGENSAITGRAVSGDAPVTVAASVTPSDIGTRSDSDAARAPAGSRAATSSATASSVAGDRLGRHLASIRIVNIWGGVYDTILFLHLLGVIVAPMCFKP